MTTPDLTADQAAAYALLKKAVTEQEKLAARAALKLAFNASSPDLNPEQFAANELRRNAVTREEKDIAIAALKLAFPNMRPGLATFRDGEEINI
jgi:hypothetical protein